MSLVVYKNGQVAADSIAMLSATQFLLPKIYPYRAVDGECGVLGFVGNASVAMALCQAYVRGGEEGYRTELEWFKDINEDAGACILIAPAHGHYLLSAGYFMPLFRMPVQEFAMGYDMGVNIAQTLLSKPGYSAAAIVEHVIAMQSVSNEVYVKGPVETVCVKDVGEDYCDKWCIDFIKGQFIMPSLITE